MVDTHWWQKRKREKIYQRVKHLDDFHGFLKNCLVQSKTAIENMK